MKKKNSFALAAIIGSDEDSSNEDEVSPSFTNIAPIQKKTSSLDNRINDRSAFRPMFKGMTDLFGGIGDEKSDISRIRDNKMGMIN